MRIFSRAVLILLSSVPPMLLAQAAHAQDDARSVAASPPEGDEEIIVTATRRNENIQDVPMVVTAISDKELKDNNTTKFSDIAALSPGLSLQVNSQGPEASLRGVSSVTVSGGPPAVDVYFNESSLNSTVAFRSIYDIGQIEVLRGPQGTLRGDTAPSGAVTVATRRPDLDAFGGSGDIIVSARERIGLNGQAALNIPIVRDKVGLRLAALFDRNDNGGTRNVFNGVRAESSTVSARASLLVRPTDNLEVFAMYQYLRERTDSLARVEGAGLGYNGPLLSGEDNLAVQEAANHGVFRSHLGSLIAKLDLGPASLTYVGGYRNYKSSTQPGEGEHDPGNAILNYGKEGNSYNYIPIIQWTHELRLDSSGANRFWDYTLGIYKSSGSTDVRQHYPQVALPGAFGNPATAGPVPTGPTNPRYMGYLTLHLYGGDGSIFGSGGSKSIFASSTFHLPTGTHVRVGARHIWFDADNNFVLDLGPAYVAAPVPFPQSLCPAFIPGAVASPSYPNACDILAIPGFNLFDTHVKRSFKAWVYDLNVRQDITDDIMVYASYGRNWRAPGISQGNVPPQYITANPEVSKNVEIGIKADLLDRRLRFSAAVFQQDFRDFNATTSQIPFLDATGTVVDAFSITYNGDARVRGFEADLNGQINSHWSARGSVSYSKSNFKDALIPCRDSNFDGVPDTGTPTAAGFAAAGVNVASCRSSGAINGLPKWNFTLQSEYRTPLAQAEAYVRALYNWQSDGLIVSSNLPIEKYGTLNLYAGARGVAPGLDVGIYVKNAFDVTRRIDQGSLLNTFGYPTGYRQVIYTQGREVGATLRLVFGGG